MIRLHNLYNYFAPWVPSVKSFKISLLRVWLYLSESARLNDPINVIARFPEKSILLKLHFLFDIKKAIFKIL
jgi:hypothetical protein